MCSPNLFDIIRNLEDSFTSDFLNTTFNTDFKLYKSSKNHKVADYICYASNHQCALQASKHWESKCVEKFPWIKDFIKVNIAPHGFNISLNRNLCFQRGLEDVSKSGRRYGLNTIFMGKVFDLSIIKIKSSDCLTNLRMDIASQVISVILKACGGAVCNQTDCNTLQKIHITSKNVCCNDCIKVLVGHVSLSGSEVSSEVYKRLRMGEISVMCEHKRDISDDLENKNKLLKAIISFDLLQSNIWRSVTINLDKDIGEFSSCKGSMFVMYNYARLHSLCKQFEEKVSNGIYPPLPSLDKTDLTLLNKDEEWKIMFDCILCWPSVLRKSTVNLESGKPKIHLIFDFLKTSATDFSQYYHRIRIFTEARDHLLPTLFARMHLLKSLLIVFEVALELVCISPLSKM